MIPGCPGCLTAPLRRGKASTRNFSSFLSAKPWARFSPPRQEEPQQPVASTSRLPGGPIAWERLAPPPHSTYRQRPTRHVPSAPPAPPPLSDTQLKQLITSRFASSLPRRALHAFRTYLPFTPPATTFALVDLFLSYQHPTIALEAISLVDQAGLRVPPELCIQLLRTKMDDLVLEPDNLSLVIGWLESGIAGGRSSNEPMEEELVAVVLDALKRLGRADWVTQIFEAYRSSLPPSSVGSDYLWSILISAQGQDGDLLTARRTFDTWRSLHFSSPSSSSTPPPERPYLTLLDLLSTHSPRRPPRSQSPDTFLTLIASDALPLSPPLFASLLRLELSRKRFPSFWNLFTRMDTLSSRRNRAVWRLAIKAALWETSKRTQAGPGARGLLKAFLEQRHRELGGRTPDAKLEVTIVDAGTLDAFLRLFVERGDWPAAEVVLECYGVHRVEPSEKTHGVVVLGVVRGWEKGRVEGLKEAEGVRVERRGWGRMKDEGEVRGAGILRRILEERKMRVGMWTIKEEEGEDGEGRDERARTFKEIGRKKTPGWMRQREMREMGYLSSLLRRCEGLGVDEWKERMKEVRKEVLPAKRKSGAAAKEAGIES